MKVIKEDKELTYGETQAAKREFERDSGLTTPLMRSLHFAKHGTHSEDDDILAWHNSQIKKHPTSKAYQESIKTEKDINDMEFPEKLKWEDETILSLDIYIDLIRQWAEDRGIVQNGKPMGQAIKTLEETTELIDALNRDDKEDVSDSVGDIFVTLCNVCSTYDLELTECVAGAYEEIKDRKGFLRADGTFIKD